MEAGNILSESIGWLMGIRIVVFGCDDIEALVKEHGLTGKHEDDHDNDLIKGLWQDISPHGWSNDPCLSAFSLKALFLFFVHKWLSADSACGKNVHNKVHPQQVNDLEWWFSNRNSRDEYNTQKTDVHCQLELNEFPYVFINCSTPHNCAINRLELIIEDNKIRIFFGNMTGSTHGNTNLSSFECSSIGNVLTTDKRNTSSLFNTFDQKQLILISSSSNNSYVFRNLLENLDLLELNFICIWVNVVVFQ